MKITIIGDGSAGKRHARLLGERGHHCLIVGPDKASPVQHPEADAVVIASPPETHKLYLSWYGDKHPLLPILCEGPVTYLPLEGKDGCFSSRYGFGPPRMTASNWRWVPSIRQLKENIRDVVMAHFYFDFDLARWRPDIDYHTTCYYLSGIDYINLHSVDLAFYFLGPPAEVFVTKSRTGKSLGADAVGLLIKHRNGAISTVNSSWHASRYQFGCKFVMKDGRSEEASFNSPTDDSIVNVSYGAMLDSWLEAIEQGNVNVEPSLLDGYRAFRALMGECV